MEARGRYMKQSKLEIHIEEDIMKLYHTLVQQRSQMHGVRYSLTMLRELMNTRCVPLHTGHLLAQEVRGPQAAAARRHRRAQGPAQQQAGGGGEVQGRLGARGKKFFFYKLDFSPPSPQLHEVELALKEALERLREVMGRIAGARVTK